MRAKKSVVICLGAAIVAATAVTMYVQPSAEPQRNSLGFTGVQAGASFEAEFHEFRANINFDPEHLAQSRFDVTINMGSVDSQDSERDTTMKGPDLFATSTFPTATYVADRFTDKGDYKYVAAGKLTLRGITREVPVEFAYEAGAGGPWIKGSAALQRLDFGVGQGEWRDTTMVANEVEVRFSIPAKPPT